MWKAVVEGRSEAAGVSRRALVEGVSAAQEEEAGTASQALIQWRTPSPQTALTPAAREELRVEGAQVSRGAVWSSHLSHTRQLGTTHMIKLETYNTSLGLKEVLGVSDALSIIWNALMITNWEHCTDILCMRVLHISFLERHVAHLAPHAGVLNGFHNTH